MPFVTKHRQFWVFFVTNYRQFFSSLKNSINLVYCLRMENVEQHPLKPFLPQNAKLLMLGSFPPSQKRWSMEFYYPNWINDMWRIMGLIFFDDKDYFCNIQEKRFNKDLIVDFLNAKGIALSDTAKSIVRLKDNASDKFLEIKEEMDIPRFLDELAQCKAIVVTGQKACDTLCARMNIAPPAVGEFTTFIYKNRNLRLYRQPSSSRAYPKPLSEKAKSYRKMFCELGLIK